MQISTETGYTFKWTMLTVPEEKIKGEIISFCAGLRKSENTANWAARYKEASFWSCISGFRITKKKFNAFKTSFFINDEYKIYQVFLQK